MMSQPNQTTPQPNNTNAPQGAMPAYQMQAQPQFVPHPHAQHNVAQPLPPTAVEYQQYAEGMPHPQQPPQQQQQQQQQSRGNRVLKISSGSNPKTVAGAIAHISRQGDSPQMLATGSLSINQAIKAVAISRGYLEENKIDLSCFPEFRADKKTGLSLTLVKSIRRVGAVAQNDQDVQQLKVSKGSNPSHVAGAIANKLRDGQRVWVLAIGSESVCHAVKAIAIARRYLEADNMDISFRPEFTKVQFDDGRDCSALKFIILAQQI